MRHYRQPVNDQTSACSVQATASIRAALSSLDSTSSYIVKQKQEFYEDLNRNTAQWSGSGSDSTLDEKQLKSAAPVVHFDLDLLSVSEEDFEDDQIDESPTSPCQPMFYDPRYRISSSGLSKSLTNPEAIISQSEPSFEVSSSRSPLESESCNSEDSSEGDLLLQLGEDRRMMIYPMDSLILYEKKVLPF